MVLNSSSMEKILPPMSCNSYDLNFKVSPFICSRQAGIFFILKETKLGFMYQVHCLSPTKGGRGNVLALSDGKTFYTNFI